MVRKPNGNAGDHDLTGSNAGSPEPAALEDLRSIQTSQGGFQSLPEQGRRAAWLRLLGIPHQAVATWQENSTVSDAEKAAAESHSEGTPALTSSSSSDIDLDAASTSDLLASSVTSNVPLDSEGWQIGFEAEELEHKSEHPLSGISLLNEASPHQEQWHTAQSKRSRRNRRRQDDDVASHNGLEGSTSDGMSSTYGLASISSSIVDLKTDRLHRTNATAQNGAPAEPGSSGFFADLAALGEDEPNDKKSKKKSKKARANGAHSRHDSLPTSTATAADGSPEQHRSKQPASQDDSLYRLPATYSYHLPSHRDERQAELDILRSFIGLSNKLSPVLTDPDRRRARRRQLQDIVIGVLRRHPSLNYYQGYHDVVSVLLLVLTPQNPPPMSEADAPSAQVWASKDDFELVLTATIRVTLYYLRDFMAPRIDPCLGWLKCLRNLVRAADEDFSRSVVEQAASLPYFALSWVITAMAHELPIDGQETQTVFDFVLLQGPQGNLYVIAALLLNQGRLTIKNLQDDDGDGISDPAMLHHALSKLPATLVNEDPEQSENDAAERPMQRVIQSAQLLLDNNKCSIQELTRGIMGSSSVLHSWHSLALGRSVQETWDDRDTKAASLLADPEAIAQIVLDPHPSPPPSEHGEDASYDGAKKASRRRKRPVGNTATAVFVSVLFIAGMAVLIGPAGLITSSSSPSSSASLSQKSKLINDITQLGRGLAGLALCAAGVC